MAIESVGDELAREVRELMWDSTVDVVRDATQGIRNKLIDIVWNAAWDVAQVLRAEIEEDV